MGVEQQGGFLVVELGTSGPHVVLVSVYVLYALLLQEGNQKVGRLVFCARDGGRRNELV